MVILWSRNLLWSF